MGLSIPNEAAVKMESTCSDSAGKNKPETGQQSLGFLDTTSHGGGQEGCGDAR